MYSIGLITNVLYKSHRKYISLSNGGIITLCNIVDKCKHTKPEEQKKGST